MPSTCQTRSSPVSAVSPDQCLCCDGLIVFIEGVKAVENLAGIAVARVNQRFNAGKSERVDLLARLMEGKGEDGNPLGRQELTAEALTQLIAGSDTTSNTSCALLFYCLKHPEVVKKLQAELDEAIPVGQDVPIFEQVKDLKYLDCVIQETLRIHSTSSLGLPRVVPPGPGVEVAGHHFPQDTVLSVPAYTIHHSKEIWGPDADEFVPDRWTRVTEKYAVSLILIMLFFVQLANSLGVGKRRPSFHLATARVRVSAATWQRWS